MYRYVTLTGLAMCKCSRFVEILPYEINQQDGKFVIYLGNKEWNQELQWKLELGVKLELRR